MVQRIAEFTAKCEKYVGTESGGMDQAISIMGDKGLAKLVHFKPVWLQSTTATFTLSRALSVHPEPVFSGPHHFCVEVHAGNAYIYLPYIMLEALC